MKHSNNQQFEADLLVATRQVVQGLSKKKNTDDICAFALYSDEPGSSISASANTNKHLSTVQKEDPEEELYYKWSPAEWKYDSIANKRLDQLSDQLSSVSMELEGRACEQYVDALFQNCLNVLLTLKKEGLFDESDKEMILLFDVSDYENISNHTAWVRQLNTQSNANEFEEWLKSAGS